MSERQGMLFSTTPDGLVRPAGAGGPPAGVVRLGATHETSAAAMERTRTKAESDRRKILNDIRARQEWGSTCDEVEVRIDMPHQTASARLVELRAAGQIVESGRKRKTRTGSDAIVWVCPEYAR